MNERDMSLLKAVSEAVNERLMAVQEKYLSLMKEQSAEVSRLKILLMNISNQRQKLIRLSEQFWKK